MPQRAQVMVSVRFILPEVVPVPKPGRHTSQSVWATAARVMLVNVPRGHWVHLSNDTLSLYQPRRQGSMLPLAVPFW